MALRDNLFIGLSSFVSLYPNFPRVVFLFQSRPSDLAFIKPVKFVIITGFSKPFSVNINLFPFSFYWFLWEKSRRLLLFCFVLFLCNFFFYFVILRVCWLINWVYLISYGLYAYIDVLLCVGVSIGVCISAFKCPYRCVFVYVCKWMRMYVCLDLHFCTYMYVWVHACVCRYVFIYVCVDVRLCTCRGRWACSTCEKESHYDPHPISAARPRDC